MLFQLLLTVVQGCYNLRSAFPRANSHLSAIKLTIFVLSYLTDDIYLVSASNFLTFVFLLELLHCWLLRERTFYIASSLWLVLCFVIFSFFFSVFSFYFFFWFLFVYCFWNTSGWVVCCDLDSLVSVSTLLNIVQLPMWWLIVSVNSNCFNFRFNPA